MPIDDFFDEEWARDTVARLSGVGVEFARGFTPGELDEIGRAFGTLPRELRLFLGAGVPVSPEWTDWAPGPRAVADEARAWIAARFAFDIEHGGYWHALLGERPDDTEAAVDRAAAFLETAPALIPVFAHRFLATAPAVGPRAVLSVWQAVDSIIYGCDLADYFAEEFRISRPSWAGLAEPEVPVWGELFDLWCQPED